MTEPNTEAQRTPGAGTIFSRPTNRRAWLLPWGLLSALLMAFGSVGPWFTGEGVFTSYGLQHGHVWLVLVVALAGAALLVALRERRVAGFAALLSGLVGVAVTLYDRSHWYVFLSIPASAYNGLVYVEGPVHLGWGLYLALFAALSFALCGLVWFAAFTDRPQ